MPWMYLLLIAVTSRAFSLIVQKKMLQGLDKDPIAYSIVYQLITGVLIALYIPIAGFHPDHFRTIIPNLIITTILSGLGSILAFYSLKYIDASEFAVIYASRVIWTIIGTIIFLKAPFSFTQAIGAALIISSVMLVSWKVKRIRFTRGELLALLAAIAFGSAVANDTVATQHFDVILYFVLAYILPALATWMLFPKSTKYIMKMVKEKATLKLLVFCFLLAVTTITVFEAYKIGNPPQLTTLYQTSTIIGVLLAIIILKETENLSRKILGAILSFVGVLLVK